MDWEPREEFDVGKYPPVDVFRVSSSNLADPWISRY